MTLETLNQANGIFKTIEKLEIEKDKLSKYYSKIESLTEKEIEELIQIAMVNTSFAINTFKKQLENL